MKKKWIYLIILFFLLAASVSLVLRNSKDNTLNDNSRFAVTDTASITRVFLADKNNHTVLLERVDASNWTVDGQYKASAYSIRLFLKTLMSVDIKSPVSKAAHENITRVMSSSAIKVEIYQRAHRVDLFDYIKWFPYEKLTKTYYVGFATQDNLGTYMLMDGASEPFIVHIPGFKGFLSTRYSPFLRDWRDHTIFSYKYKDLKSVTMWMPQFPDRSFKAVKTGLRDFELYPLTADGKAGSQRLVGFDTLEVMDLFSSFEDIRFEAIADDMDQKVIDSIRNAVPMHVLTVETVDGQTDVLKSWRKIGNPDLVEVDGTPNPWDADRLYATIHNGEDFVLIQYFVFDHIFRPLNSFFRRPETEPK